MVLHAVVDGITRHSFLSVKAKERKYMMPEVTNCQFEEANTTIFMIFT